MRKITDHIANPVNDRVTITAMDEPGAGGANHYYAVDVDGSENGLDIHFQNGPINEVGVNGVTQEVLLAVVIDRLRSFLAGPFVAIRLNPAHQRTDHPAAPRSVRNALCIQQRLHPESKGD